MKQTREKELLRASEAVLRKGQSMADSRKTRIPQMSQERIRQDYLR